MRKAPMKLEKRLNMNLQTILNTLTAEEKAELLDALLYPHVLEDLVTLDDGADPRILAKAADLYVYGNKRDANVSYWANLEEAIRLAKEQMGKE